MSDICKCTNEECLIKEKCYRYKVAPHPYWQSYNKFLPDADNICLDLMPIYKKEETKLKDYER